MLGKLLIVINAARLWSVKVLLVSFKKMSISVKVLLEN